MTEEVFNDESISRTLLADRHRLRRLWQSLQKSRHNSRRRDAEHPGSPDSLSAEFQRRMAESLSAAELRRQRQPSVSFELDLPILAKREEIAATITRHQVVVVSGETGSGKSTQLPKICLDAGLAAYGMIGHTQPRRIAARSIASRLCDELGCRLGEAVGFKVRFTDATSEGTYIKLMTDGILLAETQGNRWLDAYSVVIIDEAHERSLNIDFLLGYLHQLLPKRPELRVVITSATIDSQRFAEHFTGRDGPAPIIEVSGRSYPVDIVHRSLRRLNTQNEIVEIDELSGIVEAVTELGARDRGHILVFLPTERDIRETAKRLRGTVLPGDGPRRTEILPLYARLSVAEQNRVFADQPYRRIVLATNVAESSLTVPGIRYVVDTGTVRISRYSPYSKVQRLPIEEVSRASANQRAGRCGRVAPGICIRLYDEENYLNRPEFTTPEIQRTSLAAVILRAQALNLGPVEEFPFIDPPRRESIRDGYRTLYELGAVNDDQQLTEMGKRMSRFPVDPRIARIVLAADAERCLREILIIASALEVQDPRDRPHDRQQQADQQHAQFKDERSDFMSLLRIWDYFHAAKERLSRKQLERQCQRDFLSFNRMREWTETHRQLQQLVTETGMRFWRGTAASGGRDDYYDAIHRALLTGFLSGVAYRSGEHEYTGAGGLKFFLWPGSGLFKSKPTWCLAAELIETTRRYGRTVAQIKPEWIESLAAHLIKHHHQDPHWNRKSGRVMVWQSITLFGLPIVNRRRVPYHLVDPGGASEIFVRDALAARQLDCQDKFYLHNESIIDECQRLAAKTRRAHWMVDQYTLYRFYNDCIPADVFDMASLRRWLKADAANRAAIRMNVEDLLPNESKSKSHEGGNAFPDSISLGSLNLPVTYAFSPGDQEDGLTVAVPQAALGHLTGGQTEWLVPGLIEEKITALIRSLPKSIRRGLIPAPETAKRVVAQLSFGVGEFSQEVAKRLSEIAGEPIGPADFRWEKLPPHLRMNLRVIDDGGKTLATGRDVRQLRDELKVEPDLTPEPDESAEAEFQRVGITTWDFGELPKQIVITRGGIEIAAYPTLVDNGDSVSLRLLSSSDLSTQQSRAGVRRLYAIAQRKALRSQISWLPRLEAVAVLATPQLDRGSLMSQVRDLLADRAFFAPREKLPRSESEFRQRLENAAERIGGATHDVAKLLPKIFEAFQAARLAIEQSETAKFAHATRDARRQLETLMDGDFLLTTPWMWLIEFPRYLQAIAYRMERLPQGSLDRDLASTKEIDNYWNRYITRAAELAANHQGCQELVAFRWMLEEYRVSCFAQPLGTSITVSPVRLEKQWAKAEG